jgi:ethanolaminephosphotransferase
VEGILLICVIYLITAFAGPQFWDTPIVSLIPGGYGYQLAYAFDKVLNGIGFRWKLEHLGVNVAFMMFGGLGTIGNIVNRYALLQASALKLAKILVTRTSSFYAGSLVNPS